jgi:hypothetical protein
MLRVGSVAIAFVLTVAACKKGDDKATRESSPTPLQRVDARVGKNAQTPNLTVGPDGSVVMTWQEDSTVKWRRRDRQGAWSAPRTVVSSEGLFVNWADFPVMLALGEKTLLAAWLERSSGEGYGARFSQSVDGGSTWAQARWLHEDTAGPEYGFVSMTPLPGDRVATYWLDGRVSGGHDGGGAMQLRSAVIDAQGGVSERRLVDERVCDCCQTAAATTSAGPVVVYRDRSETEIRDIAVAGPGIDQRRRVAADDWKIAGCPVNGPAIVADDSGVAVAWFSAPASGPRVSVAFADDSGPFGDPTSVGLSEPLGRVDVVWLDARRALVSFIDVDGQGKGNAALVARVVGRDGAPGSTHRIATVPRAHAAGFPRMVRAGDRVVWAWTEDTAEGTTVRLAEAPVASLLAN